MRKTRRFVCAALVAAMLALCALPACAARIEWGSKTIHLISKSGDANDVDIFIDDLNGAKVTDVKSSKSAVVSIVTRRDTVSDLVNFEDEDDHEEEDSVRIGIRGRKKGSAVVSFKIGGKLYKRTYTVVDYVNPLKSFVLTGIGSANLKAKWADGALVSEKLKADAKAGEMKLTAASGWKLKQAAWVDMKNDEDIIRNFSKGASSVRMGIPAMKKSGEYVFKLHFVNSKTKADVWLCYFIGRGRL